jgi:hypothetical protein
MFAHTNGHGAGDADSPLTRLARRKQGDLSVLGSKTPFGHNDENTSTHKLASRQSGRSPFIHEEDDNIGRLTPNAPNLPTSSSASTIARPSGKPTSHGGPKPFPSHIKRLSQQQHRASGDDANKSRTRESRLAQQRPRVISKGHTADQVATQSRSMAANERQKWTKGFRSLFASLDAESEAAVRRTDPRYNGPPPPLPNPYFEAPLYDFICDDVFDDNYQTKDSKHDSEKAMMAPNFQTRDFASVAAAVNPSDCSFYIHYTLSEDRTGTQDEVMSRRLAPLAEKSRSNAFMDDSKVNINSKGHSTFTVSRKSFDEYRRSFVSSFPAL